MTQRIMRQPVELIPPPASELNQTNHSQIEKQAKSSELGHSQSSETTMQRFCSETWEPVNAEAVGLEGVSSAKVELTKELKERTPESMMREDKGATTEDNEHERLKKHRIEVAGRVWIPDIWGQEEMLKDWIDCSAFDSSLVSTSILSARKALVQEGRRANSGGLKIENRQEDIEEFFASREVGYL